MKIEENVMNYTIAVCDDEKYCRENIIDFCKELLNEDIKVDEFTNGISLLKSFENKRYDIIFLDIDIPELNGLQVKNLIGKKDTDSAIIFVTHFANYKDDAFGKNVYGFLEKPININKLRKIISCITEDIYRNKIIEIYIDSNRKQYVYCKDIKLIKAARVYEEVLLTTGAKILARMGMNQLEQKLHYENFQRVSRSIIANWDYAILRNKNEMEIDGGIIIKIPKKKSKELINKFYE